MREILFRGKQIDNGEWVYGNLVKSNGKYFIYYEEPDEMCQTGNWLFYKVVDPSTVGQYTGLTDKNGKKIFEGDIVRYDTDTNRADNKEIHEVVFETRGGSGYFGIRVSKIETWQFCLEVPAKLMEVVGNMHDNPELLKGAEQ